MILESKASCKAKSLAKEGIEDNTLNKNSMVKDNITTKQQNIQHWINLISLTKQKKSLNIYWNQTYLSCKINTVTKSLAVRDYMTI